MTEANEWSDISTLPADGIFFSWSSEKKTRGMWNARVYHNAMAGQYWVDLQEDAKKITHWKPYPATYVEARHERFAMA